MTKEQTRWLSKEKSRILPIRERLPKIQRAAKYPHSSAKGPPFLSRFYYRLLYILEDKNPDFIKQFTAIAEKANKINKKQPDKHVLH